MAIKCCLFQLILTTLAFFQADKDDLTPVGPCREGGAGSILKLTTGRFLPSGTKSGGGRYKGSYIVWRRRPRTNRKPSSKRPSRLIRAFSSSEPSPVTGFAFFFFFSIKVDEFHGGLFSTIDPVLSLTAPLLLGR